jgi:hypothetical protein
MEYIKLSDNVLSSQLGEESVILDHVKGEYFGLEGVGSFVWELIQQKNCTVADLEQAIVDTYEVDPATAKTDLQNLLAQLKEENLIC